MQEFELSRANRIRIARAFRSVPRVDLSIDCVIEGQMGKVFVDEVQTPHAYRLQVGQFVYFAGNPSAAGADELARSMPPSSLLMPSSSGWTDLARSVHGDRLSRTERSSFSSEGLMADHLLRICRHSIHDGSVRKISEPFFRSFTPGVGIGPVGFDSSSDFVHRGIGYYIEAGGRLAGMAWSSLVCSRGIEVSVSVAPEHRMKGMATVLSAYLVMWCLENGVEPHWDAANPESCRLAEKLGYTRAGTYRAHLLKG